MMAVILAFAAAFGPYQAGPAPGPPASEPSLPPDPPTNGGDGRWGFVEPSRPEVNLAYEREAKALQAEMNALQESDGGRLTAEHRAYLRKKVEALLSAYHRDVRRVVPVTVNADGSKPN